jgi:hypothetical protein
VHLRLLVRHLLLTDSRADRRAYRRRSASPSGRRRAALSSAVAAGISAISGTYPCSGAFFGYPARSHVTGLASFLRNDDMPGSSPGGICIRPGTAF